jgi:hypothetical protein
MLLNAPGSSLLPPPPQLFPVPGADIASLLRGLGACGHQSEAVHLVETALPVVPLAEHSHTHVVPTVLSLVGAEGWGSLGGRAVQSLLSSWVRFRVLQSPDVVAIVDAVSTAAKAGDGTAFLWLPTLLSGLRLRGSGYLLVLRVVLEKMGWPLLAEEPYRAVLVEWARDHFLTSSDFEELLREVGAGCWVGSSPLQCLRPTACLPMSPWCLAYRCMPCICLHAPEEQPPPGPHNGCHASLKLCVVGRVGATPSMSHV